jgi:hypothetical protein
VGAGEHVHAMACSNHSAHESSGTTTSLTCAAQ